MGQHREITVTGEGGPGGHADFGDKVVLSVYKAESLLLSRRRPRLLLFEEVIASCFGYITFKGKTKAPIIGGGHCKLLWLLLYFPGHLHI